MQIWAWGKPSPSNFERGEGGCSGLVGCVPRVQVHSPMTTVGPAETAGGDGAKPCRRPVGALDWTARQTRFDVAIPTSNTEFFLRSTTLLLGALVILMGGLLRMTRLPKTKDTVARLKSHNVANAHRLIKLTGGWTLQQVSNRQG